MFNKCINRYGNKEIILYSGRVPGREACVCGGSRGLSLIMLARVAVDSSSTSDLNQEQGATEASARQARNTD